LHLCYLIQIYKVEYYRLTCTFDKP
jgi:hypothetical protein